MIQVATSPGSRIAKASSRWPWLFLAAGLLLPVARPALGQVTPPPETVDDVPPDAGPPPPSPGTLGAAPAPLTSDQQALLDAIAVRLRAGASASELKQAIATPLSPPAAAPTPESLGRPLAPLDEDTGLPGVMLTPDVRLSGYAQTDYLSNQLSLDEVDPSTGAPLNQNRFEVRRARVRVAAERSYLAGALEFDGNTVSGPAARIIDAEATAQIPGPRKFGTPLLGATIGMFKIPFGFEVLQADTSRLFLERSAAEHGLFPGEYDLGARLAGGWEFLRYAVAFMNGEPAGETTGFPGQDPNNAKDLVGRIGLDVKFLDRLRVAGGFSFDSGTGFHKGTPATKPVLVWNDLNGDGVVQSSEITVLPGSPAIPSQDFSRFGLGGDLELSCRWPVIGTTMLYSELYSAKNLDRGLVPADPVSAGRDLREFGWYAALTQQITSYAQVGVRFDYYNPDQDETRIQVATPVALDASYSSWAITAAFTTRYGRLIVEGDLNQNHLGRDVLGNPTNLKSNQIAVRGEVKF
jgi:hypothetical protein